MSYRPITDIWFLARAKLLNGKKYYGAYLGGFPERARILLGASANDCVLHVCGGMARHYPYKAGFGSNDMTMDMDPDTVPDILHDIRKPWPIAARYPIGFKPDMRIGLESGWRYVLADPPYSTEDAAHYKPGAENYPKPNEIMARASEAMQVGGRIGLIHYILPAQRNDMKFLAAIGVMCGFNNRIRVFSVWEKIQ